MTTTADTALDEMAAMRATNVAIIQAWVDHASAGFLKAEYHERTFSSHVSIGRADEAPLDGEDAAPASDRPVTGVLFDIYVPSARRLDRRHRNTLVDVRDAVRTVLVRYIADVPMSAYSGLSSFEYRNRLR